MQVLRSEGPAGFYKGFLVTAYREVPSLGLYFLTYKSMHTALHRFSDSSQWFPPIAATLLAGGCAGASSWVVVYVSLSSVSVCLCVCASSCTGDFLSGRPFSCAFIHLH